MGSYERHQYEGEKALLIIQFNPRYGSLLCQLYFVLRSRKRLLGLLSRIKQRLFENIHLKRHDVGQWFFWKVSKLRRNYTTVCQT